MGTICRSSRDLVDDFVDGNILILFRLASPRQAELEFRITAYVVFWFHSPNYVIPPPPAPTVVLKGG